MKNPPAGVKLVMASVCVMKGIPPEKIPDPAGTGQKVRKCFILIKYEIIFSELDPSSDKPRMSPLYRAYKLHSRAGILLL